MKFIKNVEMEKHGEKNAANHKNMIIITIIIRWCYCYFNSSNNSCKISKRIPKPNYFICGYINQVNSNAWLLLYENISPKKCWKSTHDRIRKSEENQREKNTKI